MTFMIDRVHPDPLADHSHDYARVAKAIEFIVAARPRQVSLDELSGHVSLSPFHLQRLFKRWAGISPKQFIGYLTLEHAKRVMQRSTSVLDATYEVGLSGPSRLHDLFVAQAAMTPGEYLSQGRDLTIRYGIAETPFGRALILSTSRGVCGIDFIDTSAAVALRMAQDQWPLSEFIEDHLSAEQIASQMFGRKADQQPIPLLLRGTNFQVQVWSALMRVPPGAIVSYGDLAKAVGNPTAQRAVGTALSENPIAYAVPCHRVLRATGLFKNYKWTPIRRHALLAWEASRIFTGSLAK